MTLKGRRKGQEGRARQKRGPALQRPGRSTGGVSGTVGGIPLITRPSSTLFSHGRHPYLLPALLEPHVIVKNPLLKPFQNYWSQEATPLHTFGRIEEESDCLISEGTGPVTATVPAFLLFNFSSKASHSFTLVSDSVVCT